MTCGINKDARQVVHHPWRDEFVGYLNQIGLALTHRHLLRLQTYYIGADQSRGIKDVTVTITNDTTIKRWTRTINFDIPPKAAAAELLHWLRHAGLAVERQESGRFEWE